ncbi:hypothetical protein I4U23_030167 [Adineta vaga]|nr:hypothetical protein I4U23_030167 [Adineta vaga]
MIQFLVIYSFLYAHCLCVSFGTVRRARFTSVNQLNSDTIWLNNQSSSQECLCTVLRSYNNTFLFNSYTNGSCHLFFSLPYTYRMEFHINSTTILLKSLPPINQAPCCSNLSWLMSRIKNSSLPIVTLSQPTYLVIDDLDYLAVISYNNKLYRYNRTSMISVTSKVIAAQCMSISYYKQQYFVGCGTSATSRLYVFSTTTLAFITNITVASEPRDVVFIRNGTVMLVSLAGTDQIAFYNVISSTSYILTNTISAPYTPYNLYRINDTFLYMTSMTANIGIYTLRYNGTTNGWIWNSVSQTNSGTSSNFQTTFDACGRMWISVKGFGIRIYDSTGTKSLYNWTLSSGLNTIALTQTFDLYAADFINGQILSYRSRIDQCTS